MARLFAHSRAVRPLPFAKGWIRVHSACAQAQRSTTAAIWSLFGSWPIGSDASSWATSVLSFFSKRFSSPATVFAPAPFGVSETGSPAERANISRDGNVQALHEEGLPALGRFETRRIAQLGGRDNFSQDARQVLMRLGAVFVPIRHRESLEFWFARDQLP